MSALFHEVDHAPVLDAQTIQHDRAIRLASIVQKYASTLCQREVRTRLVETGIAPAWSTSNTITFAESDLADLGTVDGVLSGKGLALHEVSHILFTPRSGTDIVRWVVSNNFMHAFNALEDQRIETLMVGRFGAPIVPWLTAVIAQHLVATPQHLQTAFPLIRGRKYLPVELRRACRDLYSDQANVAELSAIIDEYRVLLFPEDTERAKELITRYAELVKHTGEHGDFGCESRHPDQYDSSESRPVSKKYQQSAKQRAELRNEQDEADTDPFDFGDPANNFPEEDEPQADETDGDADGDEGDESDASGSDSSSDEQSNGAGDEPSDDPIGDILKGIADKDKADQQSKQSASGQQAGQGAPEALNDLLNDLLEDVKQTLSEEVNRDLAKVRNDTELLGNNSATPRPAETISGTVTPDVAQASRAFGIELERLRAQFDPGWEREVSSGRISTSRYLRGAKLSESFDRWSIGREDAVDIEAVILLDASGSMSGDREQRASNAMWGLKRALDKVGANCTVVSFSWSGSERVLYKAEETASSTVKRVQTGGGTDPEGALKYATRVLSESDRAVKVLFSITDGEWSNEEACDEQVRNLRRAGVLTALAHISGWETDPASINAHQSEIVSSVTNASDLFLLGRSLVRVATKRNLAR